jgi:ABC-type multidrug transport system, ATPase component
MNAIEIKNLTKLYRGFPALAGVDLTLESGQIVGLLGENGCGKTTLLKVLAGVLTTYTGQVKICGNELGVQSKANVAFLPDTSFLNNRDTVGQCLEMYKDFFADFSSEKTEDLLALFGLNMDQRLSEMSKGMKEKVQIALIMGRNAKVYLLDEPISGVDPAAREVLLEAITRHLNEDSLVLISTHLVHDLEPILDAVVMMQAGRILVSAKADDLREEQGLSLDGLFRKMYR